MPKTIGGPDTIFAESTAPGRAGLAVIRVSGPGTRNGVGALVRNWPPAREARLTRFREPGGAEIDRGLLLWFPAPASYTGEDCAELHVHGSRAVVSAVMERLGAQPGLRPAEAGEFTRRAVLNGKMDLVQAEGLADLIDAETAAQRLQALTQLDGRLSALYEDWRQGLIAAMAGIEAAIDFSDEDLPEDVVARARAVWGRVRVEIDRHLRRTRHAERVRGGVRVAIVGPPNAGKSSLLNMLAARDVAIVSDQAGTTRDVLTVSLDLNGVPVVLSDGAGLRPATPDQVEAEGIRRARQAAERADIVIPVFAGDTDWQADSAELPDFDGTSWLVVNKVDLLDGPPPTASKGLPVVALSCRTGAGFEAFLDRLSRQARHLIGEGAGLAPVRDRHRLALEEALDHLDDAARTPAPELAAESLRAAAVAIGRITGRVDIEDVLDTLFADFCIGK